MRMICALVGRLDGARSREEAVRRLDIIERRMAGFALRARPVPASVDVIAETWRSSSGLVRLVAWTNEPETPKAPLLTVNGATAVGRSGYVFGGVTEADLCAPVDPLALTEHAGGCFGLIRADDHGVQAVTDVTRSNAWYDATSPHVRIVSSRALLTSLIAVSDETDDPDPNPQFDLFACRAFATSGYFLGDFTAFTGVESLQESSCLRLGPYFRRKTHNPIGHQRAADPRDPEWRSLVEAAAGSLVEALEPISGATANLSLTGGRDSRLIAAAVHASGRRDFEAATSGRAGHPDVDLAATISQKLGLPHVVREPAATNGAVLAEEPMARIVRNLDVHDAHTSAWDDIQGYGPMNMRATVSGAGGEMLRGGILVPDLDDVDGAVAAQRVRNAMVGGSQFVHPEWTEMAAEFSAPWVELAERDPLAGFDRFFHEHRNGRWMSTRRASARFRANAVDPLLDNRLIRFALATEPEARWSERLVFDMITLLAPVIRDVPLEGRRWRFERNAPWSHASASERDAWGQRVGLAAPTAPSANYAWQRLYDPVIRAKVEDVVRERVEGAPRALLRPDPVLAAYRATTVNAPLLWHLASTCVLFEDPWHRTSRPDKVMTIPVASS
jgi:hypothetical protein